MHARITHYKMKAGSVDAARQLQDRLKGDIMGLPGMRHFYNAMKEDGSGYIVSIFEPSEMTADSPDRVKAIWANFSDLLEAPPVPEVFDLLADWEK